jgi:putative acyl-CoA dehydrogenase
MAETPYPNQPPPYEGGNLYLGDAALREAVAREGAAWADPVLIAWGERMGSAEALAHADAANRFPPVLRPLDRRGERLDAVEFHPSWHELMRLAAEQGEHASPWRDSRPGRHVARAARYLLHAQVENGTQCPLTMTFASVPALLAHGDAVPGLRETWLPRILALDYDPRPLAIEAKRAALVGMGMTERQGGSDVRSNRTRASAASDGTARIRGEKWFFSAPQCDAHLVLAQGEAGLGCYLLPRMLPDGTRNAIRLVRLKEKLGNRSNASAEVEFDDALAYPVGAPGRGIATILDMVQHTRLDCVLGSAGIMRAAFAWAAHNARHRVAFGRSLIDQPLMRNVLADVALEAEAACALALRLARAFESGPQERDGALARVLTPAAKYWICKRATAVAAEAMEAIGGNGYIEEHPLPRFYREAPVNSIWEGSGNVIALDVQRALARERGAREALSEELAQAGGSDSRYDAFVATLARTIDARGDDAAAARSIAQSIALAVQASLLLRHAPAAVADGFCASRLVDEPFSGAAFGALPAAVDTRSIVERASPPAS